MACEIKELEFENYGNCLSVSNGMIEAVVAIDVGPRIIYFGFIGGENVLYNDLNREYRRAEPNSYRNTTEKTPNILLTEATASDKSQKNAPELTTRIISL